MKLVTYNVEPSEMLDWSDLPKPETLDEYHRTLNIALPNGETLVLCVMNLGDHVCIDQVIVPTEQPTSTVKRETWSGWVEEEKLNNLPIGVFSIENGHRVGFEQTGHLEHGHNAVHAVFMLRDVRP